MQRSLHRAVSSTKSWRHPAPRKRDATIKRRRLMRVELIVEVSEKRLVLGERRPGGGGRRTRHQGVGGCSLDRERLPGAELRRLEEALVVVKNPVGGEEERPPRSALVHISCWACTAEGDYNLQDRTNSACREWSLACRTD